jgi:hypothetical protein
MDDVRSRGGWPAARPLLQERIMIATPNRASQAESQANLTLLDLIEAVAEVTDSEAEVVTVVRHLVNSGRVRLIGNFRGARID